MLGTNSTAGVAEMQGAVIEAVSGAMKAMCWYWWEDPFRVMQTTHSLPGLPGISIERTVTPQQRRRGRFDDLDIRVDPYSMQYQTPQQKLQALDETVKGILAPLMGLLQQQGVMFDAQAYLAKRAELLDMPDLADIVTVAAPPVADTATPQEGGAAGPQAETTRNYVRRSLGGESQQGQGATLEALLESSGSPESNGQSQGY